MDGLPWHDGAYLVDTLDEPTNIWRRWRFLGRMTSNDVSFCGELYAKGEGAWGDYRHEPDAQMQLDFRELDLREAHQVGLA